MSLFPTAGYLVDAARTEGEGKTAWEDWLAATKQIPGAGVAETTLILASDAVTPPSGGPGIFMIDTEAAAANDNLANIVQTNIPDGSCLRIRPANAARSVTVKHNAGGSGQLSLRTGGDFTLGATNHWLDLKRTGTTWEEVARSPREGVSGVLTKTATYATTEADRGKLILCTSGTFTLTLLAAARAGIGFDQYIKNSGTGFILVDGNASETIDGATTLLVPPGDKVALVCDGANWHAIHRYTAAIGPKGHIQGYTYANGDGAGAGDLTNDITIAAGTAMDATDVYLMTGAAITKQLDANWAVGTNAGGLDTGAIANADYYIWDIARPDTGVDDKLFSLSSTAPTMPTNYTYKRLIGWFKRVAGAIVLFHAYETAGGGIDMDWDAPTLDVNLANTLTTSRRTDAVKVPLNFSVRARLRVVIKDGSVNAMAYICCPDQTDVAPSATATPLFTVTNPSGFGGAAIATAAPVTVRTSATGTIAARADTATVDLYAVVTDGFTWDRRN